MSDELCAFIDYSEMCLRKKGIYYHEETVHGNINVTKFHRAIDYSISHSNYFTDERAKNLIDLFVEKKK